MRRMTAVFNEHHRGRFKLDPRTKLFILFTGNIAVLLAPSLQYELLLAAAAVLLGLLCGLYRYSFHMALVYGGLSLIQFAGSVYLSGAWQIFVVAFAAFFRKLFPCAMLGGILVSTTKISEFMAAMNRLGVSRAIAIPFAVSLRYFPLLREDWGHIRNAMRMRGLSPALSGLLRHPQLTLEYIYAPMLVSASHIADELSAAAMTRGIERPGPGTCLREIGFKAADAICAAGFGCLLAASVFAEVWR